MAQHARRFILSLLFVASLISPAFADVTRVAIAARTVVANGQWFGAAGPYEKITDASSFLPICSGALSRQGRQPRTRNEIGLALVNDGPITFNF